MNRLFWYMFVLILVLLLVAYYKGTTNVIKTGGQAVGNLAMILQGRNPSNGQFASYPGGA